MLVVGSLHRKAAKILREQPQGVLTTLESHVAHLFRNANHDSTPCKPPNHEKRYTHVIRQRIHTIVGHHPSIARLDQVRNLKETFASSGDIKLIAPHRIPNSHLGRHHNRPQRTSSAR